MVQLPKLKLNRYYALNILYYSGYRSLIIEWSVIYQGGTYDNSFVIGGGCTTEIEEKKIGQTKISRKFSDPQREKK